MPEDLDAILEMLDLFTAGHPAERHPRPREVSRQAIFGPSALARILVAEERGRLVGYAGWRLLFDFFWAMHGAELDGLFVRPEARGRGVALALIAAVCAEVRGAGGQFLRLSYGDKQARFYERFIAGGPVREGHLSQAAFDRFADLAGRPVRDLVRGLPSADLNHVPAGTEPPPAPGGPRV
jgi:GNAT superfamily N-acetyltransferase